MKTFIEWTFLTVVGCIFGTTLFQYLNVEALYLYMLMGGAVSIACIIWTEQRAAIRRGW